MIILIIKMNYYLNNEKFFSFNIFIIVIRERYIMKDARRRKKFIKYAQVIIKATQAINIFIYN